MDAECVPLMEADKLENEESQSNPPYYIQSQPRSSSTNTVVVNSQPSSLPPLSIRQPSLKPSQTTLVMSLVLLAVCSAICYLPALFCLIPGVIFGVVGFNFSHSKDKKQCAGGFNGVSLCCSVTAIISLAVTVVCGILSFALVVGIGNSGGSGYSCNCDNSCTLQNGIHACTTCSC